MAKRARISSIGADARRPLRALAVLAIGALSACGEPRVRATALPLPPRALPSPTGHLLEDVRQVSAGAWHTCAVQADASVWCWGDNTEGQLGDGTRDRRRQPVRVGGLPPSRSVSAGARSTCATSEHGRVLCWGSGASGQLGSGARSGASTVPAEVAALAPAWRAVGSAAAERHCAIGESGSLACWGRLTGAGPDRRLASLSPDLDASLGDATAIAIGATHECVSTADGRVRCRGSATVGALGDPSRDRAETFDALPAPTAVVSVAAGLRHTCVACEGGEVWCWGDNTAGQLGLGGNAAFHAPAQVALPVPARAVVAGHAHTCALGAVGNVYCWGDNSHRQLGDGSDVPSAPSPRVARLRERVLELSAGARHTCALLAIGQLRCWGDNGAGQLGDGTEDDRAWPIAVLDGPQQRDEIETVAAR